MEERIDLDQWMMVDPILGKLLVTTRRTDLESQRWRGRVQVLSLETMTRGESRELLTQGDRERGRQ